VLLPKIKKNPKNTNGRLAIPAPAGLLVVFWLNSLCLSNCYKIRSRRGIVFVSLLLRFLLTRDAMHKRGLCSRVVSVRPSVGLSVRLSRLCILSKRINTKLFYRLVDPPF